MTNQGINICFLGKQDKSSDLLLELVKKEFREFDLIFEFVSSVKKLVTNFPKVGYDVVFLDADIKKFDLKKIKTVQQELLPLIILISSSKSDVLKAFEMNASDFIVKPLQAKAIKKRLYVIKKKMTAYKYIEGLNRRDKLGLTVQPSNGDCYMRRILIRKSKKMVFVDVNSIIWIESESNYNRIYTEDDSYLNRGALKYILQKLDPHKFFRIHRSVIINIDMVKQIEPFSHGDYKVVMRNGTELKISRNYTDFLSDFKCTV